MENLIIAFNCILPMFLTMCVGFAIHRSGLASKETFDQLSTASFYTLLPCLMFHSLYSADLSAAVQPGVLLFLTAFLSGWFVLHYGLCTAFISDPRRRGAYIQNSFRSNIVIVAFSLGRTMMDSAGMGALSVASSLMVPLFNVMAVVTLETCRGGRVNWKKTLTGILTNPLILACALGILFLAFDIRLPGAVESAVSSLGTAGSVCTLLALGASIQLSGLRKNFHHLVRCTFIRLVLTPVCALTLAVLLNFRGNELLIILLCTATPFVSTAYPMALACDSDHELTGQAIVVTSMLCCLTLFLWIFLLMESGLV